MSKRSNRTRLRRQFETILTRKESEPTRFRAIQGNGAGTVKVSGKPRYIYIRRLGRSRFEECLNVRTPPRNDLPVIVGYLHELPGILQVLDVDWSGMVGPGDYAYVPPHHESHELRNEEGSDDVVWVQKQQVLPLLVYPTSPTSLFVGVFGGWYQWDTDWHYFEEAVSDDLTARVPAVLPANARFVLVTIDGATETLQYTNGDLFPMFLPPVDNEDMIPAPPEGEIPLAAIYLPFGTTEIEWDNIYDVRLMFSGGGAMSTGSAPRDASYVTLGLDPILSAERVLTAGADVVVADGGAGDAVTVGRAGDKILKFDSDGAVLAEYAATYAGLVAALAATADGDVIWLPQCEIPLEAAITIPANVTLTGLTQSGTTEVNRPWMGAPGSEQYPKLYNPAYDASTVTLVDGAVLEGVQVYRHAGEVDGAGVECAVSVGDGSVVRRCNVRCLNNGTKRVAGIYLWGSGAEAKDCVAKGVAGNLAGGNDGEGILLLGNLARAVDCTGLATSSVGVAAGIYVTGDCEVLRCIGDAHVGLLVAAGTSMSRFSYYSGVTTDLQVDVGAILSVYSDQYASQTINGTLTCLAGDRAGVCRDEIIIGDWNINAGEFGLPSGGAFPGAPQDGDIFYRTDLDGLYVYGGVAWDLMGGIAGALPPVAAAGYALVSDGVNSWVADQTPLWTGEHSFEAGIAFVGASGENSITIPDNLAAALHIVDDGDADIYFQIVTTTGSEEVIFNAGGDDVNFTVQANGVADALQVQGSDGQITLGVLTAGFVKSSAGGVLSVALEVALAELGGYIQGTMIRGGIVDWETFNAGGAGWALVSTGITPGFDQTPLWTGRHSFEAGIAFTGASGANEITVPDATAIALELLDAGGLEYMRIVSIDANPYFLIDPAGAGIKVGIGTTTVPHGGVGIAAFALDGPNASVDGPHVQVTTDADDYPLFQLLAWQHDNVELLFDSYWDGAAYRSSDVGSNFKITKASDRFRIYYDSAIAQGNVVTWLVALEITQAGRIGVGGIISPVAVFEVATGGDLWTTSNWQRGIQLANVSVLKWKLTSTHCWGMAQSGGNFYIFNSTADDVSAAANYVIRMTPANYVGIGIVPTVKLEVQGDADNVIAILRSTDAYSLLSFWDGTTATAPSVGTHGDDFRVATGGVERLRIVGATGVVRIANLAGVGARNVVADAAGNLSAP